MKYNHNEICPRCGGHVPNDGTPGAYIGAISRVDNRTEICSACGEDEGIFNFIHIGAVLPPLNQLVFSDRRTKGENDV